MFIKNIDQKRSIKAPGQNRTDASSLEGYSSTTELQAREEYLYYVNLANFMQ